ncbi:MAG: hypothetical protein HC932_03560 [Thermales bacterium]|nr:hypothetical protein [Thermales bacterium]
MINYNLEDEKNFKKNDSQIIKKYDGSVVFCAPPLNQEELAVIEEIIQTHGDYS